MEIKLHTLEQVIGKGQNQKGNRSICGNKWKWKYSISKLMECSKSSSEKEVMAINTYIKQIERWQTT